MADFSSPACAQYLNFQSATFSVTNRLFVDRDGVTSITTLIGGDLLAPSQRLWALHKGELYGEVERLSISITEADNQEVWASVHLAGEVSNHHWMHINLLLLPPEFSKLFHPIWIRQARSQLQISLEITGRHIPIEAAFSEVGDITNSAFEAEKRLPAKLTMLEVTTLLSDASSPRVPPTS